MTEKPRKPSRQVRDGFSFAILAALKAEDWESHVLPVTVELRRHRHSGQPSQIASPRMNWHMTVEANQSSDAILNGWQTWHFYGEHPRPWFEISESLCARLTAIADAAWGAGVRRLEVAYMGDADFSGHELIELEAEAAKWPSTRQDSNR